MLSWVKGESKGAILYWGPKRGPNLENYPCDGVGFSV